MRECAVTDDPHGKDVVWRLRKTLSQLEVDEGPDSYEVATTARELADLLAGAGHVVEAAALYRRVLPIQRRNLGNFHPSVAITLYQLAILLEVDGPCEEADSLWREARAALEPSWMHDG
jgi:hypothetical protein